jgi:hypothetical protein
VPDPEESSPVTPPAQIELPSPLRAIQVAAWAVVAVMVAAIVLGLVGAEEGAASALLANAWGRVTIIDLYLALGAIGSWIAWRERSVARTSVWIVALVLTGSIAVGVYVALAAGRSRTMTDLLVGESDISLD